MTHQYRLRIRELPTEEKPREKLTKFGPESLSNQELLAIILGKGTQKEDVLEISSRILQSYGSNAITHLTTVEHLKNLLGLGHVHSCQIVACFELGRRFFGSSKDVFIRAPNDAFEYLKPMSRLKKENFRGLYLDVTNRLIHDETISIGTLTTNLIHPREVFGPALKHSTVGVILAHNHPSGDPISTT